ncbi:MAG: iron chelate uptake ABC transporter family permease subunit, partial [Phycisphaerae bacterium]
AILLGLIGLFSIAQSLNVLSLGSPEALGLGVSVGRTNLISFALAAFITAIAVSLSGLIGFVGLIVPHGVRLVFGPDHRQLLPLSALCGAALLVIADTVARTIIAPAQLPVGIITALAGGPFFLFLLARYSRKVNSAK